MRSIFVILALYHVLGQVTAGSKTIIKNTCAPVTPEMQITLLVDLPSLISFLATPQSDSSGSTKYTYSKEYINCTKTEGDCSAQVCCRDKKPTCNKSTEKCDCLDSSNKFTGRPLIYIKNSGKCGAQGVGCTICMDVDGTVENSKGLAHVLQGLLGNRNVSSEPKGEDGQDNLLIEVGSNGATAVDADLTAVTEFGTATTTILVEGSNDILTTATGTLGKMIEKHNH